jgi:hypothetical protein
MLGAVVRHLQTPPVSGNAAAACHDLYGNDWRVDRDGTLKVLAPGAAAEVLVPLPSREPLVGLAGDCAGFLWAATAQSLYRLNPRAPGTNGATDPAAWQQCRGLMWWTITAISTGHRADVLLAVTMADGTSTLLDVLDHDTGDEVSWTVRSGPDAEDPSWEVLPGRLPVGNHDHFVAEASGRLWVAGGLTHYRGYPATLHVFNELFRFTPSTGLWDSVPMPAQRAYNALAAADGQVFVVGGSEPKDPEQALRLPTSDFFIYDIASNSWSEGPRLPQTRMECTAVAAGGRVWVICGVTKENAGPTLDSMLSWAPRETAWRDEPPAPAALRQFGSAVIGDVIYCCGGIPSVFMAFDTSVRRWLRDPELPEHPTAPQVRDGRYFSIWIIRNSILSSYS